MVQVYSIYISTVADMISVSHSWFVIGGEGEGIDIGKDDIINLNNDNNNSALDEFNIGSLAEFAAKLTAVRINNNKDNQNNKDNKEIINNIIITHELNISVDAAINIKTKCDVLSIPPRFAFYHSSQVRH